MINTPNPLIEIKNLKKYFRHSEKQNLLVLDQVNFNLYEGEIIALLGRSGSGKSTLLRIIAGLTSADEGEVIYRGEKVDRPIHGISMVFQRFALMPWLTVLQNVELGLEALGIPKKQRRKSALKSIDTIGLDGYEIAFPRELSGGMQQRVGFARALVVNPDVLLMDEPFSALDVLTSENLRNDLLDLWQTKQTNTNCILMVTHNIEEAVLMADRIIIFDHNPGRILKDLAVDLPHPRDEETPGFRQMVDQIYRIITQTDDSGTEKTMTNLDLGYRIPDAEVSALAGLIETLLEEEAVEKSLDLSELAEILHYQIDELFPLIEVLSIMKFTIQNDGSIQLTEAGELFAKADILQRKLLFAKHLLNHIPIARHIRTVLARRFSHRVSKNYFLAILEDYLSTEDAQRVLRVVISWGRYAEIFAYDDSEGKLSLENPQ